MYFRLKSSCIHTLSRYRIYIKARGLIFLWIHKYLQDRVVEVPYEKVVYQDKVDVQYVDVERVVEHIVRKEVPGLLSSFPHKIPQLWMNYKSLMTFEEGMHYSKMLDLEINIVLYLLP
jgi:hypothetical protein